MTDTIPFVHEQSDIFRHELKKAFEDFLVEIMVFPVSQRNAILFDEWSLRDIVAHLSGWNVLTKRTLLQHRMSSVLEMWLTDEYIDQFNANQIALRDEMMWEELLAEFKSSAEELLSTYSSLPQELWGRPFNHKDAGGATPSGSLNIDLEHVLEHLQQIKLVSATFRE